ncbi:hypothetical protein CRENBAI_003811 [Crenichthys baileyi]|uniref:Uncharacterized protein n=1 Tax=Crenichthys baileyi TaxID=28760 RepID=A0AAV9SFI1_9TELE
MQSTEANCVPGSSQQTTCLYNAEWSSFPSLKEGQRYRNTARRSACSSARAGRTSCPTPQLRRLAAS